MKIYTNNLLAVYIVRNLLARNIIRTRAVKWYTKALSGVKHSNISDALYTLSYTYCPRGNAVYKKDSGTVFKNLKTLEGSNMWCIKSWEYGIGNVTRSCVINIGCLIMREANVYEDFATR